MATKTARKKFRPPLKTCRSEQEGPSLPCSQASSTTTSGLPGTSQQERVGNAEQDSQSWLSQLTAAAVSTKPKDASPAVNTVSQDYAATAQSNKASSSCSTKAGLDDSLSGSERRMEGLASPASDPNCTLTHTMLSYCSESGTVAGNFGAAKRLNKYEVSLDFPESGNSAALDKCSPASHKFENAMSREKAGNGFLLGLFSVESEEEMMALDEDVMTNHDQLRALSPSRFQRKNKTTTRRYDYSTMLPKLGAQRTTTKKQKKNSKAKSVRLVVKQGLVSQVSSAVCCASKDTGQTNKADLSVYDYQPTPQKEHKDQSLAGEREVTFDLNNSNWISRKTREEQVSVCVCVGGGGGGGCSVNIM